MNKVSRVQLADGSPFNKREWLRREVLWASLMTPYSYQLSQWLSEDGGTRVQQHNGNVSRRDLFSRTDDPEHQAQAFLNHGKVVAGLTLSAIILKISMSNKEEEPQIPLEIQADVIDRVLKESQQPVSYSAPEKEIFMRCVELAHRAHAAGQSLVASKSWLQASKLMRGLASNYAHDWIDLLGEDQGAFPQLIVPNGGTPRSSGPRVEELQPIFHEIVESEQFKSLSYSTDSR